jgi:hypothetical protein
MPSTLAVLALLAPAIASAASMTTVIRDATVIPMDREHLLPHQDVVIGGDRIVAVRPTGASMPAGATVVDGSGRFVVPGLVDAHVHLYDGEGFPSFLSHGVTTLFDLNGSPQLLALRADVKRGARLGPTLFVAGPSLNGFPPGNPTFLAIETPEDARAAVLAHARAGYDLVKVYSTLSRPAFEAAMDAADARGLAVVGHVPWDAGTERALASGLAAVAHAEELLGWFEGDLSRLDRVPALADVVAASGAAVVPNLTAFSDYLRWVTDFDGTLADPEWRFASAAAFSEKLPTSNRSVRPDPKGFEKRLREGHALFVAITRALSARGVPLLAGTDTEVFGPAGESLHRELAELVAAGLTPFRALEAATAAPGRFAAEHLRAAPFGQVAAGHRADLLLLDANPLDDVAALRRVTGVVLRGRWLPERALPAKREAAAARPAPAHARHREIDRLIAANRLSEAADALAALVASATKGDAPPVAMAVFHNAIDRAKEAGDARTRARLADAWNAAFPGTYPARLAQAEAALDAGDRARAEPIFYELQRLLPYDARPRLRLAELAAARAAPRFEPIGTWRFLSLQGTRKREPLEGALRVWRDGKRLAAEVRLGEKAVRLARVAAGDDRLVAVGTDGGNEVELHLRVDGDRIQGRLVTGFGRNHPVSGRRAVE